MARRALVPNPAWVTKALAESYEVIQERVPPKWLPKITETGSQRGRLVGALKEYGCGAYGCVLPTLDPRTVLKVTTDSTEAQFAADMSPSLAVPVVVDYRLAMRLAYKHEKRTIYLLWRESAEEVGAYSSPLIDAQHAAAKAAYIEMYKTGSTTHKAITTWKKACADMAADPELEYLATGMLRVFDEQGVFFGDVHGGNIGKCLRGGDLKWVIVDPGHVSKVAQ